MGYIMTEENPITFMGNLLQLMHDHGQEVIGKGVNVNLYRIATMIQAGLAKVFVLWYNDEPVGYSFWFTGADIMFAHKMRCDEIALYVVPKHRGRPAVRFIKFTENCMKEHGFQRICRGALETNPLVRVLRKLGYKDNDVILVKEV